MQTFNRETIVERRQPQMRWSAVLAGAALTIGLWIFLQAMGMGLGLAAVERDDAGSLRGAGIGTGIWTIIAPLIAMFLGGLLAGRMCGWRSPKIGAVHGAVMWALALVIGVWSMMTVVSALASGAASVTGAAAKATSSMVTGGAAKGGDVMSALGLDANDLMAPVNQKLQAQGKPAITKDQAEKTVQAVAQRGVREGGVDRDMLVEEVARNTNLSRADSEDVANQLGTKLDQMNQKVAEVKTDAKETALEAADKTGKVLFAASMMMLVALLAAAGGGFLGGRMAQRDAPNDRSRAIVDADA